MSVGASAGRLRPAALFFAMLALLGGPSHGTAARQAHPTRRVVTYFLDTSAGGQPITQWRVFDPVTRTDTLFGTISARGVYWDTTETNVEYVSGDQVFRVRWEVGAQPWPILRLPVYGLADWWFNPDSLCWQAAGLGGVPRQWTRNQAPYARCHSELWQSDRDGGAWRIIVADTAECGGCYFCETWRVRDSTAIHRRAAVGLDRLQQAMTLDSWGGTPEPIPPPRGESPTSSNWIYIPCRGVPGRGLAFRITRQSNGLQTLMPPFYLMDRTKGTQQPLETPELHRDVLYGQMAMEEQGGFLLISGIGTSVFDLRTGAQLVTQPYFRVRRAVWIKPLAPPSVDSLGLRRLRERFR